MHHIMVIAHGEQNCRVLAADLPFAEAKEAANSYIERRMGGAYLGRRVRSNGIRPDGAGLIQEVQGKTLETIWITPTIEHSLRVG